MSALSATPASMSANRPLLAPDSRLAANARKGDTRGLALAAARTLVAEGLVKPIFAEMREGNMSADMFKPGVAEKRFRPLLDGMLADRVVASKDFPVVEVIADRFERALGRRSAADPIQPYTARGMKP
jgi:hypothetical protein